jgi:hypothetical protein
MEAIAFGIIVLIWVISILIKGFKWLLRQTGATPAPPALTAPPPSQAAPTLQNPARLQAPPPSQVLPARTPPLQARPRERQPAAGGSAVPDEATRQGFERQERELFGSEPASLNTSLTSPLSRPASETNSLFGSTDDLVRAIILQEVLGPPLSRRAAPPR